MSGWAKQPFSLEKSTELNPSWVVVFVNSPNTNEQVKFYTKSFGDKWYVDDIEVYGTK